MNALIMATIVFACSVVGVGAGLLLARYLPESHRRPESKDAVKLATGLVATMAALILGLLVGTAKNSFDTEAGGFQQLATNIILLDRGLAHYGPEAAETRAELRRAVRAMIQRLWPADRSRPVSLRDSRITAEASAVHDSLRMLKPTDEFQRSTLAQATQIASELARNRWQLTQYEESSLPGAFLAVLAFWLFVLFTSFSMFAPPNATVLVALFVCALSVSGAVFLIVDLDQPFEGLLQISSAPLEGALAELGK